MDDDFEFPFFEEYFFFVPRRSVWNDFQQMFCDVDDDEVIEIIPLIEE